MCRQLRYYGLDCPFNHRNHSPQPRMRSTMGGTVIRLRFTPTTNPPIVQFKITLGAGLVNFGIVGGLNF